MSPYGKSDNERVIEHAMAEIQSVYRCLKKGLSKVRLFTGGPEEIHYYCLELKKVVDEAKERIDNVLKNVIKGKLL